MNINICIANIYKSMPPIRLLSFDVGIKNLAYCIVDISQNKGLDLIEWNVLNLCDHDVVSTAFTCAELQKNGKVCGKLAKYCKDTTIICCEKHAKTSTKYKLPQKEHTAGCLKKLKINELRKLAVDKNVVGEKREELLQALLLYFRETEWEIVSYPKKQNASSLCYAI
jgi:hypothetical protein